MHISHAHRLWETCANKDFEPYFVELAGHNNIEKYAKDYLARIRNFIEHVDNWVAEKNRKIAMQEALELQYQREAEEYEQYEQEQMRGNGNFAGGNPSYRAPMLANNNQE